MFHRVRNAVRSLAPVQQTDRGIGSTATAAAPAQQDQQPETAEQIAVRLRHADTAEVAGTVRELLDQRRVPTAIAVATALTGTHEALAAGIVAGRREFTGLAWHHLRTLPTAIWSVHAPDEYVRAGLDADREALVEALCELVDNPPVGVPAKSWLALLGPVFAHRESALARALFERLDRAVGDGTGIDRDVVWQRDWLRDWVTAPANGAGPDPRTCPRRTGTVAAFAIMDYRHPDRFRASANIGDHVQSLAALGHLVRHQDLRFSGRTDLVDLAGRLQQRVRPEIRRTGLDGEVDLHLVQRDASHHDVLPVDTWALAFGWYMHPQFQVRCDFPFHPNLRPIFVSFHISRRQLLTAEAIDYLRRHGPIGCRDWTTVDLLLSAGVDAFFSGCLTSTLSNLFPDTDRQPRPDAPRAFIDTKPPADATDYVMGHQRRLEIRTRPFVRNVDDAISMLDSWRTEYAGITTSRLHVYLPARSIGAPVQFVPKNPSDPRFTGLAPLDDAAFDGIRNKINTRLETVLGAALAGAPVDQVYDLWRRLNADDVAAAKARLSRPVSVAEPGYNVQTVIDSAPRLPAGQPVEPVHIAIRANGHHRQLLRVLLGSVAEHSSRPVHAHVITRAPQVFDTAELAVGGNDLEVSVIDARGFGGRLVKPDGSWLGPAEVDKFLTPALIPDVDRLVLLPIGSVVTGDVAELADSGLGDHLIAAARPQGTRHTSGYTVLLNAAQRLKTRTETSEELRRIVHQRHRYDFPRFRADVLVINSRRWREESKLAACVRWAESFGLDFREALHAEFGPQCAALDPRWHRIPTQEPAADAALLHWAEQPRPWGADPAPLAAAWHSARGAVQERTAG